MKKQQKTERETRIVESRFEWRDSGDDERQTIRGYAALFDSLSENLGGFREKIAPGAFDDVLNDDVRALYNHDPNLILGRSRSQTLRISVDEQGLIYEVDLPDTQAARDLTESMNRKDVDQSSFAFTVEEDDWDEDDDGRIVRTIKKFRRLYDVSPVTYPAYPETSVGLRSMEAFKENRDAELDAKQARAKLPRYKRRCQLIDLGAQL